MLKLIVNALLIILELLTIIDKLQDTESLHDQTRKEL